jgi:predicted GIY-YIG superfamily endonuclease
MKEKIYTHWRNLSIEDIDGEEWRFIKGTMARYSVSNFGRIKSHRIRQSIDGNSILVQCDYILKQHFRATDNYLRVCITFTKEGSKHKLVHTLVANEFCNNPFNYNEVHHTNNIRTYNHCSNLEWTTRQQNIDAISTGHPTLYEVIDIIKPCDVNYKMIYHKKGKTFIYALHNSVNNIIYVGKSDMPVHRYRQHMSDARGGRKNLNWLKKIIDTDSVSFSILKEVDAEEWAFWEEYYIKKYKELGHPLNNITDGGHNFAQYAIDAAAKVCGIPVLQYTKEGVFVKEWPSGKSAANHFKVSPFVLRRAAKGGRKSCAGFVWKLKNLPQ